MERAIAEFQLTGPADAEDDRVVELVLVVIARPLSDGHSREGDDEPADHEGHAADRGSHRGHRSRARLRRGHPAH
jgi:hypothetical protein